MSIKNFFIVGCPRSGTTMLQQALNRHPQVAVPPETAFFSMLGFSKAIQRGHLQRIRADLRIDLPEPTGRIYRTEETRALYEEMARRYVDRIGKPGVTHFGDKTNEHLGRLNRIHGILPDSRIIILFRDGRDVACSLASLPWNSRDLYVNFGLWLHCLRLQRRAQQSCKLPLLLVRYEDLVREPEKELARVLAFLDLPYNPEVVSGYGNGEGIPLWEYRWKGRALDRINPHRIGVWQKYLSAKQVGILERWGGKALRDLGYELTSDGRAALPWFFHLRFTCKSLLWLARRPRYAQARTLWLEREKAATTQAPPGVKD